MCLACQPIEQLAKPTDLPSARSLSRSLVPTYLPVYLLDLIQLDLIRLPATLISLYWPRPSLKAVLRHYALAVTLRAVRITLHCRVNVTATPISVQRVAKFNCHGNLYRCSDDNRRGDLATVVYSACATFVQRDIEQGCARCINSGNYGNGIWLELLIITLMLLGMFYIYIDYYGYRCIMHHCEVAFALLKLTQQPTKETSRFWYFFSFCVFADERDAIQKKTFTKWVNKHLKKVRLLLGFSR